MNSCGRRDESFTHLSFRVSGFGVYDEEASGSEFMIQDVRVYGVVLQGSRVFGVGLCGVD